MIHPHDYIHSHHLIILQLGVWKVAGLLVSAINQRQQAATWQTKGFLYMTCIRDEGWWTSKVMTKQSQGKSRNIHQLLLWKSKPSDFSEPTVIVYHLSSSKAERLNTWLPFGPHLSLVPEKRDASDRDRPLWDTARRDWPSLPSERHRPETEPLNQMAAFLVWYNLIRQHLNWPHLLLLINAETARCSKDNVKIYL